MICKKTEIYLGWFLVILDDFQLFVKNWNLFGQFLMILSNSWKTEIYLGDSQWVIMILNDS